MFTSAFMPGSCPVQPTPPSAGVFFLLACRRRPRSTLFPYTTLFRSAVEDELAFLTRRLDQLGRTELRRRWCDRCKEREDRKSTRLNSSHTVISYAVFCLKKKMARARGGAAAVAGLSHRAPPGLLQRR